MLSGTGVSERQNPCDPGCFPATRLESLGFESPADELFSVVLFFLSSIDESLVSSFFVSEFPFPFLS